MRISMRFVAALVAAVLVGAAAGGIIGSRLGANAVVSHWVTTNANNAEETVAILQLLQAGRETQARSALETHLNRHTFGLMPSTWAEVSISERARTRAAEAAQTVRAYREQYPHAAQTALDRDVGRFLERQ